jgi:hypothetical protein
MIRMCLWRTGLSESRESGVGSSVLKRNCTSNSIIFIPSLIDRIATLHAVGYNKTLFDEAIVLL